MNIRFGHIMDRLNDLVTFRADRSMSDEDFIAGIDAVNLLCNLQDDLGLDRTGIRRKMDALYPQFSRRIKGKENIQLAMPLIKALYRYIYDRTPDNADRGPVNRRNTLVGMCRRAVAAYKADPIMHSSDYLYALGIVSRMGDDSECRASWEYRDSLNAYLKDIDSVPTEEKIRRLKAYRDSPFHAASDGCDKWIETRESLRQIDVRTLDDDTFLTWCEVTDRTPLTELRRRSGHSKRMQVEYLQALTASELEKERRSAARRKLNRSLRTLDDELIGDIIGIRIDAGMPVPTLHALETIFYLRLQLAQVSREKNEPIYESLCRDRFGQLAVVLRKKYAKARSVSEKIEMLERLEAISLTLHGEDLTFALNEASTLETLPDLTYAQKLRLEWLPGINTQDDSGIVAELLPRANDPFVMATVGMLIDYITDDERSAVLDRYTALVDAAIASNDTAELGSLLALAACWNSNPTVRAKLAAALSKIASVTTLSLPEKRVNVIAAEIYSKIDAITGKYEDFDYIPA